MAQAIISGYNFTGCTISIADAQGGRKPLSVWGDSATYDECYNFYQALNATFGVVTGLGVQAVGMTQKHRVKNFVAPATKDELMRTGKLIIKRDGFPPVFLTGKFPVKDTLLNELMAKMLANFTTLAGAPVTGVYPQMAQQGLTR